MRNSEKKSRKAQSYFASSIGGEQSMLKSKIFKNVTALCCAFAVSLTGLPVIHANAQTKEVQCEIQQTGSNVKKQGIVHTLATKTVSKESELTAAINSCPEGGTVTINLTSSFRITKTISISGNKTVYINGTNGSSKRAIGTDNEIQYLFTVKNGASVTFSDIILKGGISSDTNISYRTTISVLMADGGNVYLDNCAVRYSQGALVNIESQGNVSATDTVFSNARGTSGRFYECGGAIRIGSGAFTMGGNSEITKNSYGGVYVSCEGLFTMNGGRIYGNEKGAGYHGGDGNDVNCIDANGNVTQGKEYLLYNYGMGGGVFCNGTFNFVGGTIEGNYATDRGNGIVIDSDGKMTVNTGAKLVDSGSVDLLSYSQNISFLGAPVSPMKVWVTYPISAGTKIATCAQNVNAKDCLSIEGFTLCNDPENPQTIIIFKSYTVIFEPNGAVGKEVFTTQKEYNSTIQLPTDYQKTGYTFTGWKESKTGKICEPGSTQTVLANVTYTAVFEEKSVKVHFNLNNSKATNMSKGNEATVKYKGLLSLSSYVPSATGYKFEGWYTNKSLTGNKITSISPAELGIDTTIELYAKWSATSSNSNGGNSSTNTGSTANKNTNTTTTTNKGSVTTVTQPTKAPSSAPATSGWLSVDRTKLTLVIGEKYQLEASSDTNRITMRSNSNCVTVNNSGTVRAKRAGTATITVTSGTNTKKCRVKVKAAPKASDIKVKAKTVKKGKTVSVKPVFANNTDCMYVYYSSANTKVATVSASGKVKGLKKGTAKITIKCSTGAKKVVKIKVV